MTLGRAAVLVVLVGVSLGAGSAPAAGEPVESLRAAIVDLSETFGPQYPRAKEFLGRLDDIARETGPEKATKLAALQREALVANPLVSGQPILFVVRRQYMRDHHNTATFFPAAEHEYNDGRFEGGGAIKLLDLGAVGKVTTLVDLPEGVARDPEVSFDGKTILYSMRRDVKDSYHLYEISIDGSGPRQLTRMKDVDDLDPLYLPDGSIAFTSTREPKYCACNRHIMANLFLMNADGSNIHQIGKSTLFEGHGSLTPDGRIMYYRWEYVDRNFGDAQGLWTCNPDGTNHAIAWGNNTPSPGAVLDGRVIPGTDLILCTFSSCHDRPWGALAIVDPKKGMDGRAPVVRTWPADAAGLVRDPGTANEAWDLLSRVRLKYEDPYPLAEPGTHLGAGKYFLCSRMIGEGERTGIYLVDVFGNEILLHAEGEGCFDPMPVIARPRPPLPPSRRDFAGRPGTFYVQDVYRGTHMEGVKRGAVKWLRVVESPEKRFWTREGWGGQGFEGPAMNWHDFGNKIILGTVPVEEDGSAYFEAPAEKFVYFQLLDEKGMMIQSMRSGTMVQSGESASCIGCHEDRRTAPAAGAGVPMAVRRAPSALDGWMGEARPFSYRREVQGIFDDRCVSCHDHGKEGASLILAGDRGLVFNASYTELWRKKHVNVVGGGPAETMPAYSWGSHQSRLVQALLKGHYDVKLKEEELARIITWVDLNAPYYPSYATSFPQNPYGRSPLPKGQVARLASLFGRKMDDPLLISFDRPELSPGLRSLAPRSKEYVEAMRIIAEGREALARSPNADSEDFAPCALDRWRDEKYARRAAIEQRNREALRKGERVYDE